MRFTQDHHSCPKCGHPYLQRRKRALWMRLIGIQKHLRCESCQETILYKEGNKEH